MVGDLVKSLVERCHQELKLFLSLFGHSQYVDCLCQVPFGSNAHTLNKKDGISTASTWHFGTACREDKEI